MALTAVLLAPALASAHITISSGPAYVAQYAQEVVFQIPHGCAGNDTSSITVEIPTEITSVRASPSTFGSVAFDGDKFPVGDPKAGQLQRVKTVTWTKPDANRFATDTGYYKLSLYVQIPNAPYTKLYFKTHQVCKDGNGATLATDWIGTSGTPSTTEDAGPAPEPAPSVLILPAKKAGWNKVTVPVAITDLATWFADVAIVWKGTSAFSVNPATVEQIKATAGTTLLTALAAGDEIWVKY
jgi:uncharacterized protein YcnI